MEHHDVFASLGGINNVVARKVVRSVDRAGITDRQWPIVQRSAQRSPHAVHNQADVFKDTYHMRYRPDDNSLQEKVSAEARCLSANFDRQIHIELLTSI